MENSFDKTATGYFTLVEYPDFPSPEVPTREDGEGYIFMSMVQLCNISEQNGQSRSKACNAFGGDKGAIAVQIVRKAWECTQPGPSRRRKFVLISAAEKYFEEVGICW